MSIINLKNIIFGKEKLRSKVISGEIELWREIAKIGIYLLIFLIPLFFLPWTFNVLDFNKQILLAAFVFLTLLAWILKTLISGKLEFNLTWLIIPILIMLFSYGLSTLFSLWPYGSFWGWPLNIEAGFLTLIYFFLLYFLISNILTNSREVSRLILVLIVSGFLASLFLIFQLFSRFLLPWDFTKDISFNTIGLPSSLAVFLAILLPLNVSFVFIARKWLALILTIFVLVMVFALILINFWLAWLVLIIGSVIVFVFISLNLQKIAESRWITLPIALLIIALFFITFRDVKTGLPGPPLSLSLNYPAEISIVKESLPQSLIFGTGPGTFIYNYAKFKPKEINQTLFWNIRFERGASEVLDRLITTGILGLFSLFLIFGTFLYLGFRYLKDYQPEEDPLAKKGKTSWFLGLGIFSALAGSILSQFLYQTNFTLMAVFWILLAGFVVLDRKTKSWEIKPSSAGAVLLSFFLVLVLIFGAGIFFLQVQKWVAEKNYAQAQMFFRQGDLDQAISKLRRAIDLNPKVDLYWQDLAQIYLLKFNPLLQKSDLSQEEIRQAGVFAREMRTATNRAINLNQKNVANWNIRGLIYRNLINALTGVEDLALESYLRAKELEPANPYILTEIGRVYLAKSDLSAQQQNEAQRVENLRLAQEYFEKSIELKGDYAPAHFQLAMINVREGKIQEAIDKLEAIKIVAPSDTGLAFQLGLIYYHNNQFDKAKAEFERAIALDPNYSNARYFLGLIYDREGKKNLAIDQFVRIEAFNPDNEEVKKILANLREGKPALEGIVPAQLPLEEKPSESIER